MNLFLALDNEIRPFLAERCTRVRIGRNAANDVCISNSTVSDRHVEFELQLDGWWLKVEGESSNDTFLNNERIPKGSMPRVSPAKGILQVGDYRLRYTITEKVNVSERDFVPLTVNVNRFAAEAQSAQFTPMDRRSSEPKTVMTRGSSRSEQPTIQMGPAGPQQQGRQGVAQPPPWSAQQGPAVVPKSSFSVPSGLGGQGQPLPMSGAVSVGMQDPFNDKLEASDAGASRSQPHAPQERSSRSKEEQDEDLAKKIKLLTVVLAILILITLLATAISFMIGDSCQSQPTQTEDTQPS